MQAASNNSLFKCKGRGKLLLSGEYAVLDGATGLAMPTRFGQSFRVEATAEARLDWLSLDHEGNSWLNCSLDIDTLALSGDQTEAGKRLADLIRACRAQKPDSFRPEPGGLKIETRLDFPREWGLGSSSTLLYCLGEYCKVDPYLVLEATFGGSGYDIACAAAESPILYQHSGSVPGTESIQLHKSLTENLYFVYLGQKMNSREGIRAYREAGGASQDQLDHISAISRQMAGCTDPIEFAALMREHENIISGLIGLPPLAESRFTGLEAASKSLGAWGGDFAMLCWSGERAYLQQQLASAGCDRLFSFEELIP